MIDLSRFRNGIQELMTDKMDVFRWHSGGIDPESGTPLPPYYETILENVKCRISRVQFEDPNATTEDSKPVVYKLKVFAPQNTNVIAGDLITVRRTVDGVDTVYEKKTASEPIPYVNHIEFYIGIKEEA